jgi:hypothetical protein
MPFQTSLASIDTNSEVIFFAGSNLRTGKYAFATILQAQKHVGIVVKGSSFYKGSQVGTEGGYLQARDKFKQVFGVRADVSYAT